MKALPGFPSGHSAEHSLHDRTQQQRANASVASHTEVRGILLYIYSLLYFKCIFRST